MGARAPRPPPPLNPHNPVGDGESARRHELAATAGSIANEIQRKLNYPVPYAFDAVIAWLEAGADVAFDIMPVIDRHIASGRPAPTRLKYFNRQIAESIATRTTPLPAVQPRAGPAKRGSDYDIAAVTDRHFASKISQKPKKEAP